MIRLSGFLLACMALFMGCERSPFAGMTQGKVVYDLELDAENMPPMMQAMMPSEAITWFADGKTCTVIETGAGFFEFRMLFDPEKKLVANLVSAMGSKVATVMHADSLVAKNKLSKQAVEYTGLKKEIAGIVCEEAVIKGDSGAVFRVFYTDELEMKAPDMGGLFTNIDGFMMEYQIEMKGMRMKLKAKQVTSDVPDPALFTIPKDYEIKKKLFQP